MSIQKEAHWLEEDLRTALQEARREPGITLEQIARVIKEVLGLDTAVIIEELKKEFIL